MREPEEPPRELAPADSERRPTEVFGDGLGLTRIYS